MINKHPGWLTKEAVDGGPAFFVVQEGAIGRLLGWGVKEKIFYRGVFPWDAMVADLPGTNFGEQGTLPRRAVSCRLIDETTKTMTAEPIYKDELDDRTVIDPQGRVAVQVDTRGLPKEIGQPKILVPHVGHVIVRIAWCSSVPIRMHREKMSAAQERDCGAGAWSYTPIFHQPCAFSRYLLAFWEVPLM